MHEKFADKFDKFMDRRPLSVTDYVALLKYGPWMLRLNHVSKIW